MRIPALICCAAAVCLFAVSPALEPPHKPVGYHSPVEEKNFYVLTELAASPATASDPALAKIAATKRGALARAPEACGVKLECYADSLRFSPSEIDTVATALRSNRAVRAVAAPLRDSGMFIRYRTLDDSELLARAWRDAAESLNSIIDVYALGRPPRYPAIDSVSYDVKSETYPKLVRILATVIAEDERNLTLFFEPTLRFALGLLDANHRDEAGRYEPLESGENRRAIERAATLDWSRYPYSVIVVPGAGNEKEQFALSPWGKQRLTLAARRYREGKAPFVLVSGGFVHPAQTAHCEAIEMKRALMADFGVPEDAILVDPHARHTTTNLRNAARELYRYGFPFDKPGLITTDQDQSAYIEGAAFRDRCLKELGYQPAFALRRLNGFDLAFTANIESLQADARDPLDP